MAAGSGVSFMDLGSAPGGTRWRIRWRERQHDDTWQARSWTIEGNELERDRSVLRVRDGLAAEGRFDVAAALAADRPPANLLDGLEVFIASRQAAGKFTAKTAATYRSYKIRVVDGLHAVTRTPETKPLPVTVLTRANFEALMARDRAMESSSMMAYATLRLLVDGWLWLADDPEAWPQVPPPPHSTKDYLPRTPRYTRTSAPTMAHVDACLRHLPPRTTQPTKMLGIWLRYTGLRADTILQIERGDVDLEGRTLWIRADKEEEQRHVPLADELVREVGAFVQLVDEGQIFRKRRHTTTVKGPKKKASATYALAWRSATDAGEVPEHVWSPPNRRYDRPEHSLRAAFQACLTDAGVRADVIDFLVGHAGETVRDRHYGRELLELGRAAVNRIPAIVWRAPEASNVVEIDRGRRRATE